MSTFLGQLVGFAVIVARLEESLGLDPFSTSEDVHFPVTFGEFVGEK